MNFNDYDRETLIEIIWEGCYAANGIKPRWMNFDEMSIEQLRKDAEYYSNAADAQIELEAQQLIEAEEELEAEIARVIELGAGDRETALRWMIQDVNFYTEQDVEHWFWNRGLLFSKNYKAYRDEIEPFVVFIDFAEEA